MNFEYLIKKDWSSIFDADLVSKMNRNIEELRSIYPRTDTRRDLVYNYTSKSKKACIPSLSSISQPYNMYDPLDMTCVVVFDKVLQVENASGIPCTDMFGKPINVPGFTSYVDKWRFNNGIARRKGLVDGNYCANWYLQNVIPIYAIPTNELIIRSNGECEPSLSYDNDNVDYHRYLWQDIAKSILNRIINTYTDIKVINMSESCQKIIDLYDYGINCEINIPNEDDIDASGMIKALDPFTKINNMFKNEIDKIDW